MLSSYHNVWGIVGTEYMSAKLKEKKNLSIHSLTFSRIVYLTVHSLMSVPIMTTSFKNDP